MIYYSRARIVDFFLIAISWQSPRRYRDIVTIANSANYASSVRSHPVPASTKHRAGWDGHTGRTGTVADSDKPTTQLNACRQYNITK